MSETKIENIYTSSAAAAPVESHKVAKLIAGRGIEGDRYAQKQGTYSAIFFYEPGRQLTMVSADAVEESSSSSKSKPLDPSLLRRNLLLRGITANDLNDMVGHEVMLGNTCRLFVHRRTVPCKYREAQCQRPGLMNAMWDACGVSCEILVGGTISVGDVVTVVPHSHQPRRTRVGLKDPGFFVRPADRSAALVKAAIIPPFLTAVAAFLDPEGFHRVQVAYNSAGQHFWSPKSYELGLWVKKVRNPVLLFSTGIAALSVLLAFSLKVK